MSAGIALTIKNKYVCAYQSDLQTLKGNQKIGSYSIAHVYENKKIINAYTQGYYGKGKDYFEQILINLIEKFPDYVFVMPKIGCGLAGGDWTKISSIIDKILNDRVIVCYL